MADPKFSFVWDSVVEEILGTDSVTGVRVKNLKTGAINEMPTAAVFIFIGQTPNNHLLKGLVDLDAGGHAIVDLNMRTSAPGVFAAGDLRTSAARQLIAACGDGATAGAYGRVARCNFRSPFSISSLSRPDNRFAIGATPASGRPAPGGPLAMPGSRCSARR